MDKRLKFLPLGIQTFAKLVTNDMLYVDKTRLIYELVTNPNGVFLMTRPRRFGKSLLVSTLEEIFRGNRALFNGLWIAESEYQWEEYPVIRLDLSAESVDSAEQLRAFLSRLLQEVAEDYGITLRDTPPSAQLRQLVRALARQNSVVILVDEYDKPILDHLTQDAVLAVQNELKGFYTTIKSLDRYLRFVFITGISKFSRVGIFSGLNNLRDISHEARFSTLLGITEQEIDRYLTEYVQQFAHQKGWATADLRMTLRHWYNGYCFSEDCERVYNPFSLLTALTKHQIAAYWFETGTPSFLINLIRAKQFDPIGLENLIVSQSAFNIFSVDRLEVVPLLFQAGYLTIDTHDAMLRSFKLAFPNNEVEQAFSLHLLEAFTSLSAVGTSNALHRLIQHLYAADIDQFFETLNLFFVQIPYDLHIKLERYYQSLFYLIFKLIGVHVTAEVKTHIGRIDAVVELPDTVYIFEFKLDGSAETALQQIHDKQYADYYRPSTRMIYLIGAQFDSDKKQTTDWKVELLVA